MQGYSTGHFPKRAFSLRTTTFPGIPFIDTDQQPSTRGCFSAFIPLENESLSFGQTSEAYMRNGLQRAFRRSLLVGATLNRIDSFAHACHAFRASPNRAIPCVRRSTVSPDATSNIVKTEPLLNVAPTTPLSTNQGNLMRAGLCSTSQQLAPGSLKKNSTRDALMRNSSGEVNHE